MRIVLDTNCLIQSISPKSAYHDIWLSVLNGKNTLCVSNEILEEYAEILNRLAGETTANLVLNAIIECRNVMLFTPYYRFNLISADPDDNTAKSVITANGTTNDIYSLPSLRLLTRPVLIAQGRRYHSIYLHTSTAR